MKRIKRGLEKDEIERTMPVSAFKETMKDTGSDLGKQKVNNVNHNAQRGVLCNGEHYYSVCK